MATSLGLALQITANTKGVEQGLSAADKALNGFASQLNSVGKQFDSFASDAGKLPVAMQGLVDETSKLGQAFRAGKISQEELVASLRQVKEAGQEVVTLFQYGEQVTEQYTSKTARLAEQQKQLDAAFDAGAISQKTYLAATADIAAAAERLSPAYQKAQEALAKQNAQLDEANRITAQVATAEERYAASVSNLDSLLKKGYITQETYNRGVEQAASKLPATAEALKKQAAATAQLEAEKKRAAAITAAAATAEERYAQEIKELEGFLKKGLISQQTFNRSVEQAKNILPQAGAAADKAGLEFSELSGLIGLLPGPLGAMAARISSFASGLKGLGKIFKGGLNLKSIISSFKSFLTPVNLAATAVVAFGAAVAGIAKGLTSLETKIELTDRAARLLGGSFDFAQGIQVAVERVGRSFTEVQEPIARFQGQLQRAREGNEVAARGFKLAGLSIEDLQNKAAPELFEELAEKFSKIEDPAKRAAAEIAVFGEQGPKLRDVFDGIKDAREDVERLGASLSKLDQSNFKAFGQSVDELNVAGTALFQNIITPFVGAGEAITEGLTTLTAGLGQFVGTALDILSPLFTGLGVLIQQVFAGIGNALNLISAVFEPLAMYGRQVSQIWTEISRIFQSYNDTVTDVINFLRKGLNDIYDFSEQIAASFQKVYDTIKRVVVIIVEFGKKVYAAVSEIVQGFGILIKESPIAQAAINALIKPFTLLGDAIGYVADKVSKTINAVGEYIDGWLKWAEGMLGIEDIKIEPEIIKPDLSEFEAQMVKSLEDVAGLGSEGLEIRLEFTKTMEDLSVALQKGEISAADMAAKVKEAQENFDEQVKAAREVQEELEKQIEKERDIIASLEEQKRIDEEFGGSSERFKASENVLAIENEIARVESDLLMARLRGDQTAIDNNAKRLAQLDQLKAEEERIASGRAEQEEKVAKLREKYAEAQADYLKEEAERIAEMMTPNTKALKAIDANSAAGADEAFRLAMGNDPNADKESKQLDKLEEIRLAILNETIPEVVIPA